MYVSIYLIYLYTSAFKTAGKPVPILKYRFIVDLNPSMYSYMYNRLVNRIPYARGLGSSSAAIVGGYEKLCFKSIAKLHLK